MAEMLVLTALNILPLIYMKRRDGKNFNIFSVREHVRVDAALEVMSRVQMKSYYRAAITKVTANTVAVFTHTHTHTHTHTQFKICLFIPE